MLFLKGNNSATPIHFQFNELHGGFYPYTLVSEQEMPESRKLRWGDVHLQQQNDGQEILVWLTERGTKTRHSGKRTSNGISALDLGHQYGEMSSQLLQEIKQS